MTTCDNCFGEAIHKFRNIDLCDKCYKENDWICSICNNHITSCKCSEWKVGDKVKNINDEEQLDWIITILGIDFHMNGTVGLELESNRAIHCDAMINDLVKR